MKEQNKEVEEIFDLGTIYYILRRGGKEAIFHRNGDQISDWFDWIGTNGLVAGQSDYYIAGISSLSAIFRKDGRRVSFWFDYTSPEGLVNGQSEYYVGFNDKENTVYIGKVNSSKLLGPFRNLEESWGFITAPSCPSITVWTVDEQWITFTKEDVDKFFSVEGTSLLKEYLEILKELFGKKEDKGGD
jgi:hypothetical protein